MELCTERQEAICDCIAADLEPPSGDLEMSASKQDYITTLPEELLQACLRPLVQEELDASLHYHYHHGRYISALRLRQVCRRFAAAVRPMLFSDIYLPLNFEGHNCRPKQDQNVDQFLRAMSESADLARSVRCLRIPANVFNRLNVLQSADLSRFTALTDLDLRNFDEAPMDQEHWTAFIKSLAQLPRLTTLAFSGFAEEDCRFSHVAPVMMHLQHVSKLTLTGIECPQPPRHAANKWPILDHPRTMEVRLKDEVASLPPKNRIGTSGLRELRILQSSRISPTSLKNFLYWPRSLERLTIDSIGSGDYDMDGLINMGWISYPWTWSLLCDSLLPHRENLRELRVGLITTGEGFGSFHLHDFPSLQTFQVHLPYSEPGPGKAAELWLTPSLRLLVLDSAYEASQHGKIYDFGKVNMEWLVEFARVTAQRKAACDNIALETIQVLFDDCEYYSYASRDGDLDDLPCMLLPRTKAEVEKHGLKMTCPDVPIPDGFCPRFPDTLEELLESPFEWEC